MRETTDIALALNAALAVVVDALIQADAISSEDILTALARVRRGIAKRGEIGPLTQAILDGIEVTAGPDYPRQKEKLWTPIVITRSDDED